MLVFIIIIRCINYSNRAVLISRSSTLWCRMLGSVQTLYVGTQCYGCYYCTPFLYVEYLIVQITLIQPFSIWVILWYRQAMEILGFLGSVHIKGQLFTALLFFFFVMEIKRRYDFHSERLVGDLLLEYTCLGKRGIPTERSVSLH